MVDDSVYFRDVLYFTSDKNKLNYFKCKRISFFSSCWLRLFPKGKNGNDQADDDDKAKKKLSIGNVWSSLRKMFRNFAQTNYAGFNQP